MTNSTFCFHYLTHNLGPWGPLVGCHSEKRKKDFLSNNGVTTAKYSNLRQHLLSRKVQIFFSRSWSQNRSLGFF